MPKVNIEGIEYNTEDLTDNGKAQLASLQFLDMQMKKLQSEIIPFISGKKVSARHLDFRLCQLSRAI